MDLIWIDTHNRAYTQLDKGLLGYTEREEQEKNGKLREGGKKQTVFLMHFLHLE